MFVAKRTRSDTRIEKAHEVLALEVGLHGMNIRPMFASSNLLT